jgi:hypothetical protein
MERNVKGANFPATDQYISMREQTAPDWQALARVPLSIHANGAKSEQNTPIFTAKDNCIYA